MSLPAEWPDAIVPHRDLGEVACARELCGDGYTQHTVDGVLGGCVWCTCPGMLWVSPSDPREQLQTPPRSPAP